jgi:hypothetical protein
VDTSKLASPLGVLLVGSGLGVVADRLFHRNPVGISFPLMVGLFLVALFALAARQRLRPTWVNLWLVVPIGFLAVMVAWRASYILTTLNVAGVLILLALLLAGFAGWPLTQLGLFGYGISLLEANVFTAIAPVPVIGSTQAMLRESGGQSAQRVRSVLIGLAIAAPLLCLFTALFSAADLVFGGYVGDVLEALDYPLEQLCLIAFFGWVSVGGLTFALARKRAEDAEEKPAHRELALKPLLGNLEASIVLFSVDLLFAAFVAIQATYLFGGEANITAQGYTYSEYARRGFFELLTVSMLTLALVLTLNAITRRETPTQHRAFLAGSLSMIALVVVILASAVTRIRLYEQAYGFTQLRLYSHVFMFWLALLFAVLLATLLTGQGRVFATGALAVTIGYVVTMDVLNPDAFIVSNNVALYEQGETGKLDAYYFSALSSDAVPYMIGLLDSEDEEIRTTVGGDLRRRLIALDSRAEKATWSSRHLAIDAAYRAMDERREVIETFELWPREID